MISQVHWKIRITSNSLPSQCLIVFIMYVLKKKISKQIKEESDKMDSQQ